MHYDQIKLPKSEFLFAHTKFLLYLCTQMDDGLLYYNDQRVVKLFLPEKQPKEPMPAVIILPGGAYYKLSTRYEGSEVARWLNSQGIAAAVLHYRMPNHHSEWPQEDIIQTLSELQTQASDLHIDPLRIGIMGFSAGGHAVALSLTRLLPVHFAILFYPVISMDKEITHWETHDWLLSSETTKEQEEKYSAQKQVRSGMVPTFIVACEDDDLVPVGNSRCFYEALQQQGVPSELHILPHGGHGWGFSDDMPQPDKVFSLLSHFISQYA